MQLLLREEPHVSSRCSRLGRLPSHWRGFGELVARAREALTQRSAEGSPTVADREHGFAVDLSSAWRAGYHPYTPNSPATIRQLLRPIDFSQDINRLAVRVAGPLGQVHRGKGERRPDWANGLLSTVASTIGGGTSEVQRNTIARRRLGLPAS